MGEAGKRVRLVHELAQLARPEELFDRGDDGPDVDQALRCDRLRVLGRHALAHHPLQPGEANADLVLDQLADGTDTAIREVVDVVDPIPGRSEAQLGQVANRLEHVVMAEQTVLIGVVLVELDRLAPELEVKLVAADPGQVIAFRVVEEVVDETTGRLDGGQLTRAQLAVQVEQGLVLGRRRILLEGVGDQLGVVEQLQQLFVALPEPERTQECGHILAALAIDAHTDSVLLVDVELEPCASARE